MLRLLRELLQSQYSNSVMSGTTAKRGLAEQALPNAAQAAPPCLFLDRLPPEIRVRVYEYLLVYDGRLLPCSTLRGTESFATTSSSQWAKGEHGVAIFEAVDTTIFLVNRQIYEEAADVFYSNNRFCVHFDYFCTCWNNKQVVCLNEKTIKHFKIECVSFETHDEPIFWERCKTCATEGFALVKHLSSLPNLRSVAIAFGDVESFACCAAATTRKLRKLGKAASLQTSEIGRLQIMSPKALIELRLPVLLRMWPLALKNAVVPRAVDDSDSDDEDSEIDHVPSESLELDRYVYIALRDILYHAVAMNTTTPELRPFMQKSVSATGLHSERLDAQERVAFTVALVECLSDIITDDAYDANVEMADRRDLVQLSIPESDTGSTASKDA